MIIDFLILCYLIGIAYSQKRWYLTGEFANNSKPSLPFEGRSISFCESDELTPSLMYGNILIKRNDNITLENSVLLNFDSYLNASVIADYSSDVYSFGILLNELCVEVLNLCRSYM